MRNRNLVSAAAAALALIVSAAGARAQEAGSSAASAPQHASPPAASSAQPETVHNTYQEQNAHMLDVDFAQLQFYKAADAELPPPTPGENRVVFMGDSITHGWNLAESFPGKPYINRGISGQTTPQMLVRFRQDVIDLHPKVVILLAGTNDIAGNTGPMTPEQTENNIMSMSELARANHIRVVLCSIPPSVDFWWAPGQHPAPKIVAMNAWIENYAARKGFPYVDYYAKMADPEGGLPKNLSKDGVHPNAAGHAIMAPLAEAGIERALKGGEERNH